MKNIEMAAHFQKYFRVVYADKEALLKQVYKIRYGVFCEELALEKNCPMDVEKDDCDAYSYHFLLQHIPSGTYAGTVRFVSPPSDHPEYLLPFEKYCLHSVDKSIIDLSTLKHGTYGEVSRLAVPARFRKRAGEQKKPYIIGNYNQQAAKDNKRLFPYISIGLYLTCCALFINKQLDYTFVMIEPRLARAMSRIGIVFKQAGDVVQYHGRRAPFYITQDMLSSNLKPEIMGLYALINNQLATQLPFRNGVDGDLAI